MAHPAHRDLNVIEKIVDELFEAHKKYLPQFKFQGPG
jgi:alpha-galactosidase/6-phospho-beta-glucosidase family protein